MVRTYVLIYVYCVVTLTQLNMIYSKLAGCETELAVLPTESVLCNSSDVEHAGAVK